LKWIAITAKIPDNVLKEMTHKKVKLTVTIRTDIPQLAQVGIFNGVQDLSTPFIEAGSPQSVTLSAPIIPAEISPQFKINLFPQANQAISLEFSNFSIEAL
jgi:hypothetical protein